MTKTKKSVEELHNEWKQADVKMVKAGCQLTQAHDKWYRTRAVCDKAYKAWAQAEQIAINKKGKS